MSAVMAHLDKVSSAMLMAAVQRAVIYDCDAERAAEVAAVLRFLDMEPMLIDHGAVVRSVMHSCSGRQALLIGDVTDNPDWRELGSALKAHLSDVTVVVYGPQAIADQLIATAGPARVLRLSFPFKYTSLAAALSPAANANLEEHAPVRMPTGRSPAIRETINLIRQVAAHDSSVLILGESGSGKEVVAHAVHESSPRRQRPFVAINCGAIPAELLESELFGHEKGAFTGAVTARKGRFEIAEGGTLFLDEIGDMSMPMQVKLLRVLQERVFERVGSQTPMKCNVRIIAATHRNLEESITRGMFREDLFYRLNVFPIEMPSLRSRIEDLPLLVRDFARQNSAEGRSRVEFSAPAFGALMHYAWPGNVRELGNLVERLSILFPDRLIGVAELPLKYRPPAWVPSNEREERLVVADDCGVIDALDANPQDTVDGALPIDEEQAMRVLTSVKLQSDEASLALLPEQGLDLRMHLYNIERTLIRQALERTDGTVAQAARLLQLRRTTLVEKLRKLDMMNDAAMLLGNDAEASGL
jgi:sigma-54 dependent transcriptional regulator, flagellar regulatory protein